MAHAFDCEVCATHVSLQNPVGKAATNKSYLSSSCGDALEREGKCTKAFLDVSL